MGFLTSRKACKQFFYFLGGGWAFVTESRILRNLWPHDAWYHFSHQFYSNLVLWRAVTGQINERRTEAGHQNQILIWWPLPPKLGSNNQKPPPQSALTRWADSNLALAWEKHICYNNMQRFHILKHYPHSLTSNNNRWCLPAPCALLWRWTLLTLQIKHTINNKIAAPTTKTVPVPAHTTDTPVLKIIVYCNCFMEEISKPTRVEQQCQRFGMTHIPPRYTP